MDYAARDGRGIHVSAGRIHVFCFSVLLMPNRGPFSKWGTGGAGVRTAHMAHLEHGSGVQLTALLTSVNWQITSSENTLTVTGSRLPTP